MSKQRGRPRAFDVDEALEQAVAVFWKHGFLSASLAELTTAMGLNKPSLYAAFGGKESLYLTALQRYITEHIAKHADLLDRNTDARKAVESFLSSLASMFTDPQLPGGCFIINGTADYHCSAMPAAIEAALRSALSANESRLHATLVRAQKSGSLPSEVSAKELAMFFMSIVAGMGVLAKSGTKMSKLRSIIEMAMSTWPITTTTKVAHR